MKIRQGDPNDRNRNQTAPNNAPKTPEAPKMLFDKGMIEGFKFDPADQPKPTKSMLRTQSDIPHTPSFVSSNDKNADWVRQDVPSLGIPYGVAQFWVKPLKLINLARLHAAQMVGEVKGQEQQAFTMMLDALHPTIKDFDIRNLTVPDYYSHLYWLRLNSYPRSPYTVPWISKYGNRNNTRVTRSNFEFEELKMTRRDYLQWQEKGISFPTVRDMEVMFDDSLSTEQRWMMNYAQYIYLPGEPTVDWMDRKVARFLEMGNDAIADINKFAAQCTHGVVEAINVRDDNFEIDKAIDYIEEEIKTFMGLIDAIAEEGNSEMVLAQLASLQEFFTGRSEELKTLKYAKENNGINADGSVFQPEMEVVKLATANITLLFSQNDNN